MCVYVYIHTFLHTFIFNTIYVHTLFHIQIIPKPSVLKVTYKLHIWPHNGNLQNMMASVVNRTSIPSLLLAFLIFYIYIHTRICTHSLIQNLPYASLFQIVS